MTDMPSIQNAAAYGSLPYQSTVKAGEKKAVPQKPIGSSQVELSDASIIMKKVRDAVDAIPEVRIKLVEEIREKIRNNQYPFHTNLQSLVDKLVENNIIA
ncbi:MAG: flagellar biosynthesis anti-sigma factor FlgM [Chitinispirillaceae bacterium]|jgi:anti-sigma28 factor (negative regulator of flagellin synthesis)|nr:flagellar biosynthesis anti-sigma factor FlgM [Chitinispirillaceae bacterium]